MSENILYTLDAGTCAGTVPSSSLNHHPSSQKFTCWSMTDAGTLRWGAVRSDLLLLLTISSNRSSSVALVTNPEKLGLGLVRPRLHSPHRVLF